MKEIKLTQTIVRELLDYDPETGKLTWKERAIKWFENSPTRNKNHVMKLWNSKNAKREAFTCLNGGYLTGGIFGKNYRSHRIIYLWMVGEWPIEVDHINGNKEDNRWVNLNHATHAENMKNFPRRNDNTSGFTGVSKKGNKFRARINDKGMTLLLGNFSTKIEAQEAIQAKRKELEYSERHGS